MITLKELAIVGIPEITLVIMFGLTLNAYKVKKDTIFKLILSNILTLSVIYIYKNTITNIAITAIISMSTYVIVFRSIWRFNNRTSILTGLLAMLFIAITEIATYPTYNLLTSNGIYLENKIILSIMPNIIKIMLILVLIKKNINIAQLQITNKNYAELTIREKLMFVLFIILILSCLVFNFNYVDLFFKLNQYNKDQTNININLNLYHIQNVSFLIIAIVLILRTKDYEVFRYYVSKKPELLLEDILSISNEQELEKYEERIKQERQLKGGEVNSEKSSN